MAEAEEVIILVTLVPEVQAAVEQEVHQCHQLQTLQQTQVVAVAVQVVLQVLVNHTIQVPVVQVL